MIRFTSGNLLDSGAEALVNTVNTVGVMGKGIALMFKEAFPENLRLYAAACKRGEIDVGRIFVTARDALYGPRWIVNFPTKRHWRHPSSLEWIEEGLSDLRHWIEREAVRSIALPPLGAGNGGLDWALVRPLIENALAEIPGTEVVVFEPTKVYQNVAKRSGSEKLTPARAVIVEAIRRYCSLGIDCTLLEAQKLAWFIETSADDLAVARPFGLSFEPKHYGPYSHSLQKMLDGLDGSYLYCARRLADAAPDEVIWCNEKRKDRVHAYLGSGEGKEISPVLSRTKAIIEGFESPYGMELLSTVDWLRRNGVAPDVPAMLDGIASWPGGPAAARRKSRHFDERVVALALHQLETAAPIGRPTASQPPHTPSGR